jgi:predicted Fe-Mo cluster-binding NifX family protein
MNITGGIDVAIKIVSKKSLASVMFTCAILMLVLLVANKAHALSAPNLALNPNSDKTIAPNVTASHTTGTTSSAIDGLFLYNDFNGRWTTYGGPSTNWLAIEFDAPTTFNQVRLYLYNDESGVRPPASYSIEYWNGFDWVETLNQTKTPFIPTAEVNSAATPQNTLNTVDFDTVTSNKIRAKFINGGASVGLVEFEVYHLSLLDTIATATALKNEAVEGTLVGQYGPGTIAALDIAIIAARAVADGMIMEQSVLDAAEQTLHVAISAFESTEVQLESYYSAFSNEAGNVIMLYVSNDLSRYSEYNSDSYMVLDGSDVYSDIDYASINSVNNTIMLFLNNPLPDNVDSIRLKLREGAFQTEEGHMNASVDDIPIFRSSQLDMNNDQSIDIEDLVKLQASSLALKDINRDGTFDYNDMWILLQQVSPEFASEEPQQYPD